MEKFKEKIRIRTFWMSVIIICAAITYFVLLFNRDKLPEISDFSSVASKRGLFVD